MHVTGETRRLRLGWRPEVARGKRLAHSGSIASLRGTNNGDAVQARGLRLHVRGDPVRDFLLRLAAVLAERRRYVIEHGAEVKHTTGGREEISASIGKNRIAELAAGDLSWA